MSEEPLISVIVPAFNAERFIAATLDSVLAQTEQRWECVVVDDGSRDDTVSVARAYERRDGRIRLFEAEHGGSSHARNAGFRELAPSSRYVTFMDADDVWLPHALTRLLATLESDDQAVGAHGLAEMIDASGALIAQGSYPETGRNRLGLEDGRLVRWPLDRPTTFDVLINGNVMFPPGLMLARRSAYDAAGPFDESLAGPEDWDMLIRLSRQGPIAFVDEVLLHYRRHDANQGALPTTPRQAWLVRCIAFHSDENSRSQRESAKRGWRAYQLMLAGERVGAARAALHARRFGELAQHLARLPVLAWRYVRGYPRPRVKRDRLSW